MTGATHPILCLNSGSSSLKFAVYRMGRAEETRRIEGAVERIGLEKPRLFIRAKQNRHVARLASPRCDMALDFANDVFCFLRLGIKLLDAGFQATRSGGPQRFIVPSLVEDDQLIGPTEDRRRAAVIVFETYDFGVGPILAKAQNVLHLGATPTVD